MNYMQFKEEVIKNIKGYLPEKYCEWELKTEMVYKVNEPLEALMIFPRGEKGASTMLYLYRFYKYYQSGQPFDSVLRMIALEYLNGLAHVDEMSSFVDEGEKKENIIYELINTEKNAELLARVPHRHFLNLSVIYRIMVDLPDGTFNSAVITNNLAQNMRLCEEELYKIASENTKYRMELRISGIPDILYMLTNHKKTMGASVILYPGVLENMAEGFQSDIYVLPSSIHEVMLVRDMGQKVDDLKETVLRVNGRFVDRDEYLSDSVYIYRREEGKLDIAEE